MVNGSLSVRRMKRPWRAWEGTRMVVYISYSVLCLVLITSEHREKLESMTKNFVRAGRIAAALLRQLSG